MRSQYIIIPTDYIEELQNRGKRLKARCFMEYFFDYQAGEVNSFGFYAKSWGGDRPMSKGTVYKWIKEFVDEIERFWTYHHIKNQQHYTHIKNKSERRANGERTKEQAVTPKKSDFKEEAGTPSEHGVNEALNIDDDDTADVRRRKREIDDLYHIYRMNTKYAGKKREAEEVYLSMRISEGIAYRDLQRSVILYLHDRAVERKFNLANFLRNKIYLNYIPSHIRVKISGEWVAGDYDRETEIFKSTDGTEYRLTTARLAELLGDGDLEFVVGEAAA